MKIVYTGLESSGKTLLLADTSIRIAKRNRKWQKKFGFTRPIYSNLKYSDKFYEKYKDIIHYFDDYRELLGLGTEEKEAVKGVDIIWDEISTHFSAMKKEPLPLKVNQWLRQGAKQGVHIYATAQEFHDIHLDFRRRCKQCYNIHKVIGSRRSGKNLPPVKYIWGLCLAWDIKIHPYNELQPEKNSAFPARFIWIGRDLCEIFDTAQIIDTADELPLEHIERSCPICGKTVIRHR